MVIRFADPRDISLPSPFALFPLRPSSSDQEAEFEEIEFARPIDSQSIDQINDGPSTDEGETLYEEFMDLELQFGESYSRTYRMLSAAMRGEPIQRSERINELVQMIVETNSSEEHEDLQVWANRIARNVAQLSD